MHDPAFYFILILLFCRDIFSFMKTKNGEETLIQLKEKRDGQMLTMLNSIADQPSKVLLESYDHYPFTVYPVPKSEVEKPVDPLNIDFHMTRFSFGNPHYIYSGNLLMVLRISIPKIWLL